MLVGAHPWQSIRLCTKIGVTVPSHPCQQRTHLCTFIHKLKGQLMVVRNHLLKDESKTDSHLECEVLLPRTSQKKPTPKNKERTYSKTILSNRLHCKTHIKINNICFFSLSARNEKYRFMVVFFS